MNEIGTITGIAVAFVLNYFFTKYTDRKRSIKELEGRPAVLDNNAKIREEINSYVGKIQAYTGACRVAMFEYSNGNYTHSNISLQFVECSYESTDESTKPVINIFKREPIAPYLKMINMISEAKQGWVRITDKTDDNEINKLQKFWRVSTSYNFKITNTVWDGVVGVSWINQDIFLTEEQISNIQLMVMRIEGLMAKLVNKQK